MFLLPDQFIALTKTMFIFLHNPSPDSSRTITNKSVYNGDIMCQIIINNKYIIPVKREPA